MTNPRLGRIMENMETKTVRCTYCGARLKEASGDKIVCPYCESVNYLRFAEKAGRDSLAEVKLKNLRARLNECVSERYHDFEEMKQISDEILNINGYDFEAKYFYALALKKNNKRNKYLEFLTDPANLAPNEASLELVLGNIIRYAKENERTAIRAFIDQNVTDPLARMEYIDKADRQIERAARFFHCGQDVFVCHRSSDGAIAETVVERLEQDGISCFISERNLEDLEIGEKFEKALIRAINSTKLFLLISSSRAFDTSSDNYVLFEMEQAMKAAKPCAEFRIEIIDRTLENSAGCYSKYFAGCQYIDAYPSPSDMLDKLAVGIKGKIERIDAAGSPEKFREMERDALVAEMAAQIERLKAEKLAYERRAASASVSEKIGGNTDTRQSEKDEVDAVFGYSLSREETKKGDLGEEDYRLGLDYDLGRNGKSKDKEKAARFYARAANAGHALAMLNLGVCYEYGDGVPKDCKKAFTLYVSAAASGNAMAQCNLGYCYFNGVGVQRDPEKAVLWYKKAVKGGNARAMNNLGYCYENGQGVEKSPQKAFKLYCDAAAGGDLGGADNAAWCLESGIGVKKDLEKARQYSALALEGGSARAAKAYERIEEKILECSDQARELYERALSCDGEGAIGSARAVGYYRRAAKEGSVRAMYNLGVLYLRNGKKRRDLKEAAYDCFVQSGNAGHLGAKYNLGYCCEHGEGTQVDLARARVCYESAALGGYGAAQYAFARFAENGIGGEKNVALAVRFYKRAAANGISAALVALGLIYISGKNGEKNEEKAKDCFFKAASLGNATGFYNYGCMLRDGGDTEGAVKAFEQALGGGVGAAAFNLGQIYAEAEDKETAKKYFEKGAALGDEACMTAAENI